MTTMTTDTSAPVVAEVEAPDTDTDSSADAMEALNKLLHEARVIHAQEPGSPLAMPLLAWDSQLSASLETTREIADKLKPKGGPSAAEVKKLVAESTNPEVVERREMLAKLAAKQKEILSQVHELIGVGVPDVDKEERDALKEIYKENRSLLTKSVDALESMLKFQNSQEGLTLVAAIREVIPNLVGSGGGSTTGGTGTSKTRFAAIKVTKSDGATEEFSSMSKLAMKTKEDVPTLYELFHGAGGNNETAATFTIENGWTVEAVPAKAAATS